MGHESRIEPWLPLTTVLLVSFRADWLRREETMKRARKENRNCWAAVSSIRVDGLAGQNSALITWGWKQEKVQPSREKNFLLTSPSIELPSRRSGRSYALWARLKVVLLQDKVQKVTRTFTSALLVFSQGAAVLANVVVMVLAFIFVLASHRETHCCKLPVVLLSSQRT